MESKTFQVKNQPILRKGKIDNRQSNMPSEAS